MSAIIMIYAAFLSSVSASIFLHLLTNDQQPVPGQRPGNRQQQQNNKVKQ